MFGVCVRVGQLPLPPAALWRCCCKPAVLQCFCAGLVNAILPGEKWVSRLFDGLLKKKYIYFEMPILITVCGHGRVCLVGLFK